MFTVRPSRTRSTRTGALAIAGCLSIALIVILFCAHAAAQSPAHRNAATWYRKAIEQYEKIPLAQRNLLASYEPLAGPPTHEVRAALANVQSMLQNLQRGSSQEFSDFNLDFSQGLALQLPHIGQLRSIAKIARADALVRLHDGDPSGAAERIASIYKLAGHGGDDRTLISSLVGNHTFKVADDAAQFGLDAAQFSPADAAKLANAVQSLGRNDPFNYVEGVAGEQEYVVDWIANNFTGETGPAEFAQKMTEFADGAEQGQVWMQIAAMDQDQFAHTLDQHDALLNRVIEIFSMPDADAAKAEVKKLEQELERGEHGLLSQAFAPAFGKLIDSKVAGEKLVAERLELYSKLATDQAKPEEIANAAMWYLRGIEELEKLGDQTLAAIDQAARLPNPQASDEIKQAFDKAQPAIDLFREASQMKRCDFAFARRTLPFTALIPPYVAGMHRGLTILLVDADRLLADGAREQALDRLAIALAASAHLAMDPVISSSLVSHHNFNAALERIENRAQTNQLSTEERAALLTAAERMSRKDPFGYIGAVSAARKAVGELLGGPYQRNQQEAERRDKAAELAQSFSADRAFFALAVYQTLAYANESEPREHSQSFEKSLSNMKDLLSPNGFQSLGASISNIAPALAEHDWNALAEEPMPELIVGGSLSDRMRRARADVRRAMLLLKSFDEPAEREPAERGAD